eukprot:1944216-Lingulodinium_polyedra.AAC.1
MPGPYVFRGGCCRHSRSLAGAGTGLLDRRPPGGAGWGPPELALQGGAEVVSKGRLLRGGAP